MSPLQIIQKGLRKRRSTLTMIENEESRKKVAQNPEEETEKEENIHDLMAMIENITEERRISENQARNEGRRVQKEARSRPRPPCCACGGHIGVKHDGTCYCGHSRCPECDNQKPQLNA